ncbi:MAG: SDR family oxidoreductase [Chloroflexi bacterium]|nr:SDR family oxidoreductase [Chloroflexota bacterium]
MRVVVTGGAGFIASHLCEALLRRGDGVVALDNLATSTGENLLFLQQWPQFQFRRHDVRQPIAVEGATDYVLHFASPASPEFFQRRPIETLETGALGTTNALELARTTGASFLVASTSEVYGDPQEHPQREEYHGNVDPIGPRSSYDEAKRFAEALTMAYRREYGTDTHIVRIFNTYGPRMTPQDGRVISNFVTQALRGGPLTVYGDGSQTRSFCYVGDMVAGVLKAMAASFPEPINLGNPEEWRIIDVAKLVVELTGSRSPIVKGELPQGDPKVRRPDISRARTLLGWEPQVPLREGLARTIAYFRSVTAPST